MYPSADEDSRLQSQIDSLQEAHDAFISIEAAASRCAGSGYFESLASGLASSLQVACVCIAELVADEPHTAKTTALYFDGQILPSVRYDLRNTPCENVFASRACVYVTGVQQRFPEDQWLADWNIDSYLGTPLLDATGQPIGLLSAMDRRQLADPRLARMLLSLFASNAAGELQRRAAETARSETESRLRLAFDAASMGAWDWDLVTNRVSYSENLNSVLGVELARMPRDSQSILRMIHPADRGQVAATVMRSIVDRQHFSIELRLLLPDGSIRWIASRGHAYYNSENRATRLIGVVSRIDDRRQADEERRRLELRVQQAQKLETLATLAGGVAHDFNNLLQAITSNVELVRASGPMTSGIHGFLDQIEAASERASDLTDQLLSYAGKGRLVHESIDVSRLALEMLQLLEASIAKKAHLLGQFASGIPRVLGDPTHLRQVVLNLIVNAAESLENGASEIRLRTGTMHLDAAQLTRVQSNANLSEGDFVYIEVADTGCGMPPEIRARIFDPFFTTKATGRGLGLAAVLGITFSHGGGVGVESEPGVGTTIRIFLPPAPQELPASIDIADSSRQRAPASVGEGTILVVDDDEFVLESARLLLDTLGFSALTAPNGQQAIELFEAEKNQIDAVLLDLTMPGLSGEAVFRVLRSRRKDLPVVFCSGFSEEDSAELPIEDTISAFLQKPFRSDTLKRTLLSVLSAAREMRQQSGS